MMGKPKLEVERLTKYFFDRDGSPRKVLDSISVEIDDSQFVCIVGASGCGKTTFIRAVGGLIPVDHGSIRIDGVTTNGPGPDRGFVFQHDSLMPWRNVRDNVTFGLEVKGVKSAQSRLIAGRSVEARGRRRLWRPLSERAFWRIAPTREPRARGWRSILRFCSWTNLLLRSTPRPRDHATGAA